MKQIIVSIVAENKDKCVKRKQFSHFVETMPSKTAMPVVRAPVILFSTLESNDIFRIICLPFNRLHSKTQIYRDDD